MKSSTILSLNLYVIIIQSKDVTFHPSWYNRVLYTRIATAELMSNRASSVSTEIKRILLLSVQNPISAEASTRLLHLRWCIWMTFTPWFVSLSINFTDSHWFNYLMSASWSLEGPQTTSGHKTNCYRWRFVYCGPWWLNGRFWFH